MPVADSQNVQRFDFSQIGQNVKKTPQGFLRIPAYLTRTGIFEYVTADGSVVREFRPADEVFKNDSLATFVGAPITDLHPEINGQPVSVDPTNAKRLQVGFVGENIKQDGDFVSAMLTITDKSMIDAIERGDRREISNGYSCSIEHTPGEYNGQRYDCIQRNIVGNHVAIGPKNWGRAGPQVALKLDSRDAYLKSIHTENSMQEQNVQEQRQDENFQKTISDLQAKLDAVMAELDNEKKSKLDANKAAQELSKLMFQSMDILGKNFDFSNMGQMDIQKAVIQKKMPKLMLDGRNDSYVKGCFDALMQKTDEDEPAAEPKEEQTKEEDLVGEPVAYCENEPCEQPKEAVKADGLAKANMAAFGTNEQKKDSEQVMIDFKRNAWKEKLAFNKENII